MTRDQPLATVAVTAFNAEDTIERALASALKQDWRPLEIIVVDDASTDATVERISAMVTLYPEIRLIQHPINRGVAAARNSLIEAASGEFVIFFDDDDESVPHRVSAQIKRIKDYEDRFSPMGVILCHASRRQIMPDGYVRIEAAMGDGLTSNHPAPSGRAVAERILTGRPIFGGLGAVATCSQAARRATYQAIGGFDPSFRRSEDTEFCIRTALAGGHFVGIAEPLVQQVMTLSSDKTLRSEYESAIAVIDKHRAVFGTASAYHFARHWIALKYQWIARQHRRFLFGLAVLAVRAPIQTAQRIIYALPMFGSREAVRRLHQHSATAAAEQ